MNKLLLKKIHLALKAARTRNNDSRIGVAIEAGKGRIVSVTYDASGNSTVEPLSEFMPLVDIPAKAAGM